MLHGYRVLDFTDDRGMLAGQILADLGADVIHVEPPGGSPARRRGPFAGDVADPERSLYWWAYARNQRSLALDLDDDADRATLDRLLGSADFLIECEPPGAMAARDLGWEQLRGAHPELIYVSITPYGQTGPKAAAPATDLTLFAASGLLFMTGDADRPPVRVSGVEQSWLFAGVEAALGALVASQYRLRTGRGQHVDASAQQALNAATQSDALSAFVGDRHTQRSAGGLVYGGVKIRLLYPATDGFVSIAFLFGATIGPATARLMRVVHERGFCDEATRDKDWIAYAELLTSGAEPAAELERVKEIVARFTSSLTKAELLALAVERNLLIAPVSTVEDLMASPQLAERGYFRAHDRPDGAGRVLHPGPFARMTRSPIVATRRAPHRDEHGDEIRAALARGGAPPRPAFGARAGARPLEGVRVLDLMWAVAGPTATRVFADYGATIVRVESPTRIDASRTLRPFRGGAASAEGSALFHTLNAGKLMLTLDLACEAGRAVFLDLVRWADVLAESFSPSVMAKLGFGYEALAAVNPKLIVFGTSLMGKTGPLRTYAGYGNMASAFCGFYEVAGWPDRNPAGPWGAYTDFIGARYNAIALLAALEHRARTGEGQLVDLAQAEASIHFLAPAILDWQVNGRRAGRHGNRDATSAPHGVYPVLGEDRWIAIAVATDAQWAALCGVLGWTSKADGLEGAAARRARAGFLDERLAKECSRRAGPELEARLLAAGVPAALVLDGADVARDAQLAARGHFLTIPHPEGGTTTIEGPRTLLSESPARPGREVPTLGRDNDRILREILRYDDARCTELVIAGALG
jgi:crotonobetainyl-CoA:carnitine CoA-transferase CaiB-like acyl-CoA transferase